MSATMHTNKLTAYFGGVPQLHLGGSVFPVQEFFLEDVRAYVLCCFCHGRYILSLSVMVIISFIECCIGEPMSVFFYLSYNIQYH